MKNILLVFVSFVPLCVRTDLPLNIEDIMTDKGKWKLETSLTYLNSENSRAALASPVYIQTGSASFIPVPTEIQENGSNTDMLAGTLGLRYGLTGNTDIYGSGSYLWHEERKLDGNGKTRNKRMSDISAGINHTFLKDGKNPALIAFLESTVYEKSRNKASSGKSWLIGATTYKAIDPIVLSLTAAYRINGSKTLSDDVKYKAGNYWMLNPNISFAVNDRISLTGGIQWLGKQPDRIDGKKESARNTSTYAHFGAGFGFTKTAALNASARFNVSGQSSSELKLGVQHTF
ncbi:meta-pathway of phenol degradation family protein [Neisseria gonorrhoeae]|uniref:meta-pathway of phenol degradation family protein n=1 Tax=Neisseria gonorrhoeae TaxID=485 RepID=UPI001BFE0D2D|nr:meta-pathway of phenol degradation family protein [Neisseria gonorrhoeae]MBT8023839.1 meta-pathway of phenol degradation family protein [Neisseria gonorrhoeae]